MKKTESAWPALIQTVARLRAPDGCPWDREQTHQSLRPYLIEEAYEVLEVIDQIHTDADVARPEIQAPFREELGDLLLQVMLHSQMASEKSSFDVEDVVHELNEKLIRRHPHVFGDAHADSADGAYRNWEKIKAEEKAKKAGANPQKIASVLDGLPKALPALQRSARLIEKVTKVGFQWPDWQGPLSKVEEEISELREAVEDFKSGKCKDLKKVESELGDALFTLCNLAQVMGVSPEDSLQLMLKRFESRFRHVEKRVHEQGKTLDQSNLEEMDQFWNEAKAHEKNRSP